MASEAAHLLDQLMGRNRNAASPDAAREHWSDPDVIMTNFSSDKIKNTLCTYFVLYFNCRCASTFYVGFAHQNCSLTHVQT